MSIGSQNMFKHIRQLIIGFAVIIVFLLIGRSIQMYLDSQFDGERKPYIQSLSATSAVIKWQTPQPSNSQLFYGQQLNNLALIKSDTTPTKKHELVITGLQPDVKYFYTLDKQLTDNQQWFKTLADTKSTASVRIWAMGDTGVTGENQQNVKKSALQWMRENTPNDMSPKANLWMLLGDIAYRSGTQKQYQKALFDAYSDVIKNTAILPVYGNHDDRRWSYFDIFTLPEKGETGGLASSTEHYFSIDYANVHVLILDSQDSSLEPDGDMAKWIKDDLAKTKAQWIIAAFHHPPYTDGSHDSDNRSDSNGKMADLRENILPILEANGVDIVLAGHSHGYERSDLMRCHYGDSDTFSTDKYVIDGSNPTQNNYVTATQGKTNGTMYIVNGSASKIDNADYQHPALPHSFKELGSLILDISGNQLSGHFINDNGFIIDRFKIVKREDLINKQSTCN